MSQVLLGVRNLSLRIAVFVALAAALAWFLGGELFPRAKSLPREGISAGDNTARLVMWYTPDGLTSERVRWRLEVEVGGEARGVEPSWVEATDPVFDSGGVVHVGGRTGETWAVWSFDPGSTDARAVRVGSFADRLEVERQLARVAAGLPVQDAADAKSARDSVLRAGDAG